VAFLIGGKADREASGATDREKSALPKLDQYRYRMFTSDRISTIS
jgi:hypothetical protein